MSNHQPVSPKIKNNGAVMTSNAGIHRPVVAPHLLLLTPKDNIQESNRILSVLPPIRLADHYYSYGQEFFHDVGDCPMSFPMPELDNEGGDGAHTRRPFRLQPRFTPPIIY